MFNIGDTKQVFEARSSTSIETLALRNGFELLLDFYREVRPSDAASAEDGGDMLLYQWGTYDWGEGSNYEINLTRQLIAPDAEGDEDIWQLGLTYRYAPSAELTLLGDGNEWCEQPSRLPAFGENLKSSQAFQKVLKNDHRSVELTWGNV